MSPLFILNLRVNTLFQTKRHENHTLDKYCTVKYHPVYNVYLLDTGPGGYFLYSDDRDDLHIFYGL